MSSRINKIFSNNQKKLVTFVTGGDPDNFLSQKILRTIIKSGADMIEIGMPFSDPMADGPTIQLSSRRAIKNGANLESIFNICNNLRKENTIIPIILMGYYNVILHYGLEKFVKDCASNGVDGVIIVDLQPEEDPELFNFMKLHKIDLIRLITPTTSNKRIKKISKNASGFLYYVTVNGITGQNSAEISGLKKSIENIQFHTNLPIIAGFGINTTNQVNQICNLTDGVVVGSSIVKIIEKNLKNEEQMLKSIQQFVVDLKKGTKI